MRSRLAVAFVALTVLVVALYGVPRALIRADQVQDREQEQVDHAVLLLAALAGAEEAAGGPVTEDLLATGLRPGERAEYAASDGTTVAAGEPGDREVGVEATAPVPGGGSVTLSYSQDALDERVRDAVLPLLLIGLALVALSLVVALVLARRLARPFQDLAGHARDLGSGRFDLDVPHYPVPEAEAVGRALLTSARSLDALVRRERDFTVNASHELRTPLAAARLRLEDLALWPSTPPEIATEVGEILQEVSRMEAAVTSLLERDRTHRAGADDVDLARLAAEAGDRWRSRFAGVGRGLRVDAPDGVRARVAPALVGEVLDLLLAHLLERGRGEVTLGAGRTHDYLELRVADQTPRTRGTELLRASEADPFSTLPRAADLAAAAGGNLAVGSGQTQAFLLRLPAPSAATNR